MDALPCPLIGTKKGILSHAIGAPPDFKLYWVIKDYCKFLQCENVILAITLRWINSKLFMLELGA